MILVVFIYPAKSCYLCQNIASTNLQMQNKIAIAMTKIRDNKKDMKPFHIDRELEGPILFKDVLSCLRTSYPF